MQAQAKTKGDASSLQVRILSYDDRRFCQNDNVCFNWTILPDNKSIYCSAWNFIFGIKQISDIYTIFAQ